MPKERLHLLLAAKSFPALADRLGWDPAPNRCFRAYLLGSISPDGLSYDLPTFALSRLGDSLHRLQGEAGPEFFRNWLDAEGARLEPDRKAWIFGLANHFLADGLLHPLIELFSAAPARPCKELNLSPRWCHHWLESELEAHWLQKLGPPDGYAPLLHAFSRELRRNSRYPAMFREFLRRAGERPVPSVARIRTCLLWQAFLLRRFASPRWGKWRSRLLAKPMGRAPGALIVPLHSRLDTVLNESDPAVQPFRIFCDPQFLEQTVTALTSHWRVLAAQPR